MRLVALAAVAALAATSATAGSVTSTIAAVDAKSRIIHLADHTSMLMGPEIDIAALAPGARVEIFAELDEDGFSPASRVVTLD